MAPLPKLTVKQAAFVAAYLGVANGNGTLSARIAGYKGNDNTLSTVATENLRKPEIKNALAKIEKPRKQKAIADREERLQILTSLIRDPKTKARDRIAATKLASQMHGDLIRRTETTVIHTPSPHQLEAFLSTVTSKQIPASTSACDAVDVDHSPIEDGPSAPVADSDEGDA